MCCFFLCFFNTFYLMIQTREKHLCFPNIQHIYFLHTLSVFFFCFFLDLLNETSDKNFVCALCLKRYKASTTLKRHVRYECKKNPNRQNFQCPYCRHIAKRKDSLNQHIMTLHSSVKSEDLFLFGD